MKFLIIFIVGIISICNLFGQNFLWWEGEDAKEHNFPPTDAFKANTEEEKSKLSKGDWLQTDKSGGCFAKWEIEVKQDGTYNLWVRKFWKHGPFSWRFDEYDWNILGRDCGLADSVDLRLHLCANWVYLGEVKLEKGKHLFEIKMADDATAAAFDCFLLIDGPFIPRGAMKPGDKYNRAPDGWFAFEPDLDNFEAGSVLDLRYLNDKIAGEKGFLKAEADRLKFEKGEEFVKFWAVNAGPNIVELDRVSLKYLAKMLAKRGVNMVRFHGPVFDKNSKDPSAVDMKFLDKLHYFVSVMKNEGIYTKLSFYFPLWFQMKPEYGIPGYNETVKVPFALLFFNPRMQEIYRSWAKGLLITKNPYTGLSLADDPAVAIIEIVNEDNYFFWTFKPYESIPEECMVDLEKKFGKWVEKKYGSLDNALTAWGNTNIKGDNFAEGRIGLYNAGMLTGFDWAIRSRNSQRAFDTVQFLTEDLRQFYQNMIKYFRDELGVKCLITTSNWTTADQKVLGPLDKYINSIGDIMDRHGYFEAPSKKARSWTITVGDSYLDKSALLEPSGVPVQELRFSGKPHIITETNWVFPNRFRTEGVILLSAYGALQGTDGIFLFALGSANWQLQQSIWTVTSPATLGQFPAASLIFRKGYIKEPDAIIVDSQRLEDLYQLKGAVVSGGGLVDIVRKSEIPAGEKVEIEELDLYDPLATYVGPVELKIDPEKGKSVSTNLEGYIDRNKKFIRSITGELFLDYDKGILKIDAEKAQGVVGFLNNAGKIETRDCEFESPMDYGAIIAVPLDDQPLKDSKKILVQVMSEETNYGWKTEKQKEKLNDKEIEMLKIVSLGDFPIIVKKFDGKINFKSVKAPKVKVYSLDANGLKKSRIMISAVNLSFHFEPDSMYYVIEVED